MSGFEWLTLVVFYLICVFLSMAAFGKVHKHSRYHTSEDDKTGAIVGSIFAAPICLLVCMCIIIYRKVND
jgi:Na+/proline symporter